MCVCVCESPGVQLPCSVASFRLHSQLSLRSLRSLSHFLSLSLSLCLSLWSFPFFPSKLWQVGADCAAHAGCAANCYLLVQPLVNEATPQATPKCHPAASQPPHHPLPLQPLLLLSSSWQLHCLQCTSPVGEALHCACPCLHYVQGSKTSPPALTCVCVCEDVEKQKVYNYN